MRKCLFRVGYICEYVISYLKIRIAFICLELPIGLYALGLDKYFECIREGCRHVDNGIRAVCRLTVRLNEQSSKNTKLYAITVGFNLINSLLIT